MAAETFATLNRRILDSGVLKQIEPYLASENPDISQYAFLRVANVAKNVDDALLRKQVVLTLVKHTTLGRDFGSQASALQRMHSADFSNEARRILDELYIDLPAEWQTDRAVIMLAGKAKVASAAVWIEATAANSNKLQFPSANWAATVVRGKEGDPIATQKLIEWFANEPSLIQRARAVNDLAIVRDEGILDVLLATLNRDEVRPGKGDTESFRLAGFIVHALAREYNKEFPIARKRNGPLYNEQEISQAKEWIQDRLKTE